MTRILGPGDRVAIHSFQHGGWRYTALVAGPVPFGPHGGKCGVWVDGVCVFQRAGSPEWIGYAADQLQKLMERGAVVMNDETRRMIEREAKRVARAHARGRRHDGSPPQ